MPIGAEGGENCSSTDGIRLFLTGGKPTPIGAALEPRSNDDEASGAKPLGAGFGEIDGPFDELCRGANTVEGDGNWGL
jgi:hypothetical protein